MTRDPLLLNNLRPYTGHLNIQKAYGNTLPISADLPKVLFSPSLSTNLICIGWLVDSDCIVSFFFFWFSCARLGVRDDDRKRGLRKDISFMYYRSLICFFLLFIILLLLIFLISIRNWVILILMFYNTC